jgi:hypothetical protein
MAIDMTGANVGGTLNAYNLHVGGDLYMRSERQHKASFKSVYLIAAKITGQTSMIGASFDGMLDAHSLQVGGSLLMRSESENQTSFNEVALNSAKIMELIDMSGASFDGRLGAYSLQVGQYLSMRYAQCAQKVNMRNGQVGGNLDLRGATLADLDLSGATVVGELQLGGAYKPAAWKGKDDTMTASAQCSFQCMIKQMVEAREARVCGRPSLSSRYRQGANGPAARSTLRDFVRALSTFAAGGKAN